MDTSGIASGAVWTTDIEQAIDGCDVFLAILSQGSYRSDICRAEQLWALEKGKRAIPVLASTGAPIPLHLKTRNHCVADPARILQAIQGGDQGVTARRTYVNAPALP